MALTIVGIRADGNTFHIPCAKRVYGDNATYLTMYPEVYEGEDFIRDSGGVPINTIPTFSVSPMQRGFSGNPMQVVTDQDPTYTPQICGYPLCQHLIDGSDVVPEDIWLVRRDMRMRRYALHYASLPRVLLFAHGMLVEDCSVEELDSYISQFNEAFYCVPVLYIGGNNLQPLAHYESLTSLRPLKVLARGGAGEVTLDFSQDFPLPVRSLTATWETVILLRTQEGREAASYYAVPADLCKRSYEALYAIIQGESTEQKVKGGDTRAPTQESLPNQTVHQAASLGKKEAIAYLRQHLPYGVAHQLTFQYSNPHYNIVQRILIGRAYATYPGQDGFMVVATLFEPDDLRAYVPVSDILAVSLDPRPNIPG